MIREVPFPIPEIELKMAWSPLLQHNPDHIWLRNLIHEEANREEEEVRALD